LEKYSDIRANCQTGASGESLAMCWEERVLERAGVDNGLVFFISIGCSGPFLFKLSDWLDLKVKANQKPTKSTRRLG
jgi:hypothetical protein